MGSPSHGVPFPTRLPAEDTSGHSAEPPPSHPFRNPQQSLSRSTGRRRPRSLNVTAVPRWRQPAALFPPAERRRRAHQAGLPRQGAGEDGGHAGGQHGDSGGEQREAGGKQLPAHGALALSLPLSLSPKWRRFAPPRWAVGERNRCFSAPPCGPAQWMRWLVRSAAFGELPSLGVGGGERGDWGLWQVEALPRHS